MTRFRPLAILAVTVCCSSCASSNTQAVAPTQIKSHAPDTMTNSDKSMTDPVAQSAVNRYPETDNHDVSTDIISPFEQCLNQPIMQWDQTFVASSMIVASDHLVAHSVVALNTDNGDAMLLNLDDANIVSLKIAENAQVACADHNDDAFRVALIERNPAQGTFNLVAHAFDNQLKENENNQWNVGVRGFVPDPGARCGFTGKKEILVTGTRPRGDHQPYHGLFRAQPRALDFFESTQDHTPSFIAASNSHDHVQILLREVRRDDQNKPYWPHVVYNLTDSLELNEVVTADFILPEQNSWIKISKSGCVDFDNQTICADSALDLTEVANLNGACSSKICMLWKSWSKSWVVGLDQDHLSLLPLPDRTHIVPVQINGSRWIVYQIDREHPDTANGFKVIDPAACSAQ